MNDKMSDIWIVIGIGNREYAINKTYVASISKINPYDIIIDSNVKYIKGRYNILGSSLAVIDGHSIASEKSKYDSIGQYVASITDITIKYRKFIEDVENVIIEKDKRIDFELVKKEFSASVKSIDSLKDKFIEKQLGEMLNYGEMYIDYLGNLVYERLNGATLYSTLDNYKTACASIEKHVFKPANKIIESMNSKISEICIVLTIKNKRFGISADSVNHILSDCVVYKSKLSNVSSGSLYSPEQNKTYNIIDLTKIANVIQV